MKIFIDYNEFKNHPEITTKNIEFEVRNQNVDYILGNLLIEIKWSWDDLYASILDKRLWKQASYLVEKTGFFILINTSGYYFKKNCAKKLSICEGAIISLFIDWRIPILILESEGAFYTYLQKIEAKLAKEKQDTVYANFKKIGSSEKDRHLGSLAQIKGISVMKAKAIFEKFGTLENIIQLNAENFKQIPKIGPKLSKRIEDFFKWKWK